MRKLPQLLCSTGPFYMLPLGQVFEALSKAGFDGAEVMVTSEKQSQDPVALASLAEDFGVAIPVIHAPFLLLTRSVYTTDPFEKVTRSVELARGVGASTVVAHPAYRWQFRFNQFLENDLAEFNRSEGLTVAVENMFPVWVRGRSMAFHRSMGIEDMKRFPAVVLDTSHAAVTGVDIVRAYEELQDRIVHIHLSNNHGTGRDSHAPLAQGVLPISAFLERLTATDYTGTITLELDIRDWAGKPAQLAGFLREQRDYCLDRLGAPAGA